jgi:hypothetical protein
VPPLMAMAEAHDRAASIVNISPLRRTSSADCGVVDFWELQLRKIKLAKKRQKDLRILKLDFIAPLP